MMDDPSLAFLRDLVHELNDPFAAIHGALQCLPMADSLPPEQRDQLWESLNRNSKALKGVLEDASTYIRVASGDTIAAPMSCDLTSVSNQALELIRPALESRGQTVSGLPTEPWPVLADPERLRRGLSCLLASISRGCRHGATLRCLVKPTPTGITVQLLGEGEVKEQDYRVILAHLMITPPTGELRAVEVDQSRGWELRLASAPVAPAGKAVKPAQLPQAPEVTPARFQGVAMVVEDNSLVRRALVAMLANLGLSAVAVETADEALKLAVESMPDIILCDLGLPGKLNGFELAAHLRGHRATQAAALVAVTGDAASQRERALQSGFDEVVGKPLDDARLRHILHHHGLRRAP